MSVLVLAAPDVVELVRAEGLERFIDGLVLRLEEVFRRWRELIVVPRVSFSYETGVMEAMPASDHRWYTVKIVNGHPRNPSRGLLTVAALGVLADVETGYPVMIADATLLTAFRTGAVSAVASKHLARRSSRVLGIIGTGSQSEFLCLSASRVLPIERVIFYDVDRAAMRKFEENMRVFGFELLPASSGREVAREAEVLITATARRGRQRVVEKNWVQPGLHINAVGGDAPGKTELDPEILRSAKVVVELLDQALVEGEVQNVGREYVYGELWEVVSGLKPGRVDENEVTVFDSVGVAPEDYAALTYLYELALKHGLGRELPLVPSVENPKDLFSLVRWCRTAAARAGLQRAVSES
ncbi:MAG: ornithine cyclodeaminase [Thermofilum sp.]